MDLPAAEESQAAELGLRSRALRARWRTASLASGWRFPGDWEIPEVDAVCAAVVTAERTGRREGAESAVSGLAGARAESGTGLAETLGDVAALHAVLQRGADGFVAPSADAMPARLVRLTALGWAEVALDTLTNAQVADPLTGLPSLPYLRTRLAELYRAQCRAYSLVVLRMDFSWVATWCRLTGMIMAADALRSVFDTGETIAAIGPSTVVALAREDGTLAERTHALHRALADRLERDPQLADLGIPHIKVAALPPSYDAACELLGNLAGA